jgi:metallo-beta-lactamase family protein
VGEPRSCLTFLGAAGTVTGSRFLIETTRARVLVDAGLFQGLKELRLRNWEPFPVPPADLDAIVLTHAHVDHVGYLPVLTRDGYRGLVSATPRTCALAGIVLPDCGHLQEEEAAYANRKGFSKHRPALPLYTEADGYQALRRMAPLPFDEEREVAPGVHVTLRPAGHILGSATVSVRLADDDDRRIVFSGDLGRDRHPVLRAPAPLGPCDIVVIESTYGAREHAENDVDATLGEAITRTVGRGGSVLIPAFAVDRTEVVLVHLSRLMQQGRVPRVPVFVDSPMALSALRTYREALIDGDPDVEPALVGRADAFDQGEVVEVRDVEESKALAGIPYPAIIVSASGMATGGRVVHHLRRMLPDRRNTVLLVGFQAAGTRGRLLADGASEIRMLGTEVPVRAEVVDVGGLSVHADQSELLDWLRTAERPVEHVHVVHGEPAAAKAMRDAVEDGLGWRATVAGHLERVDLI